MQTVKVKTHELVAKLKSNRESHREEFLKAQAAYREKVIAELDRMLADARSGSPIKRAIALPEPVDYTSHYDTEIAMLEMSVDIEVELTQLDFRRYVMDEWEWSNLVQMSNKFYTDNA